MRVSFSLPNVSTVNWNSIAGVVRAVAPFVCTMLVGYHLIPEDVANQLPDKLVAATLSIGTLVTAVSAIWSLFSNKPAAVATQAASVEGVTVVATPSAPASVQQLAEDPKQPDIVKAPQ